MSSINRIHFEHFLCLISVVIVIPVISVMKWIVCYFFGFYVIKWNDLVYWEYIYHYFFFDMCIILVILPGWSIKEQYGPPCKLSEKKPLVIFTNSVKTIYRKNKKLATSKNFFTLLGYWLLTNFGNGHYIPDTLTLFHLWKNICTFFVPTLICRGRNSSFSFPQWFYKSSERWRPSF